MVVNPKVSVLVPAYNVEKYILTFLESLVNQTLEEIEIIIVNDCSPDNCDTIINKFLSDKRIKYINKSVNEGLWKARQSAFEIATGEYVINLDPDDYIDKNYLEELYYLGKGGNLDFVLSNVTIIDENGVHIKKNQLKNITKNTILKNKSDYKILLGTVYATWFRLVKREVLLKQNYNYLMGELTLFSYQFCDGIQVGINPNISYYYRKHSTSLSNYDKSSIRLGLSKEYEMEGLIKKLNNLKNLPVSDKSKRQMLNIYTFRVFYSLAIISWLKSEPQKSTKKNINQLLRMKLNFGFKLYLKHVSFFKKTDQLFLTLCLFKLEKLVFIKLKKELKN